MIFNNEDLGEPIIKAYYISKKNSSNKYIKITSKDNKSIIFSFKDKDFNPQELKKNKKINLIEYINWDVELVTNETYYLFDLTKEKVFLTRLDDNLYNIEVTIENPDMIYCPLGENETFKKLYINKDFNFMFEEDDKNEHYSYK